MQCHTVGSMGEPRLPNLPLSGLQSVHVTFQYRFSIDKRRYKGAWPKQVQKLELELGTTPNGNGKKGVELSRVE